MSQLDIMPHRWLWWQLHSGMRNYDFQPP